MIHFFKWHSSNWRSEIVQRWNLVEQWIFLLVKMTFHLITPWGKYLYRCKIGLFVRMWRLHSTSLSSLLQSPLATWKRINKRADDWCNLLILPLYLHIYMSTNQNSGQRYNKVNLPLQVGGNQGPAQVKPAVLHSDLQQIGNLSPNALQWGWGWLNRSVIRMTLFQVLSWIGRIA